MLAGVNFAGGGGGRPDTHPEQPCSVERMTQLFASYGATARIPTLWVYSRNDKFWGPELPRVWHKAFTDRGGTGEFVSLPEYKSDGHPSFTGAPEAWKPAFEAFLKSCCTEGKRAAAPEAAEPVRPPDTPEAFTRTLAAWAARHKVEKAVIIVRRGGRVVHQAGIGGADPSSPVLLASLSKAITGACIATLVRDGRLGLDWPLSKALAKHFAAHGRPKDQRIERITIAQLLTHRAGFASATDGEDPATRSVLDAYLEKHSTREAPKPVYITMLLGETLLRDPGEAFAYSNAGYMLLGAAIEEATGQAYEEYCREAVLKPAGAAGALDPTWGVLWATGGWRMAGADYLAFLEPARSRPRDLGVGRARLDTRSDGQDVRAGQPEELVWSGHPHPRCRPRARALAHRHLASAPTAGRPRSALCRDEPACRPYRRRHVLVHPLDATRARRRPQRAGPGATRRPIDRYATGEPLTPRVSEELFARCRGTHLDAPP